MSVIVRGAKNAFRSGIRTTAVVLILAISMGLALSMLLANQGVKAKLEELKRQVGTTIIVNPAGSANMQGGGEPLTQEDVQKVKSVANVGSVTTPLHLMLTTADQSGGNHMIRMGGSAAKSGETNLESSIDSGTLGDRMQGRSSSDESVSDIKLPIRAVGIDSDKDEQGHPIKLSEGKHLQGGETHTAVVGKDLADKNSLKLGSTFTAYNEIFTVVGIFDSGTKFGNDSLYIPLATAQRIGEVGDEVSNMIVVADSVENLDAVVAAIKQALGEGRADVTPTERNAMSVVESLRIVQQVSLMGFFIALAAAGVIIFLTMLMIVRERRREIAVFKAIGGSNRTIVAQFVVEAMVLVFMGAIVGMGVAVLSGNGIANALVDSNVSNIQQPIAPSGGGFRAVRLQDGNASGLESAKDLVGNVTANVTGTTLLYGLVAAMTIALIGSAVPAWLTAKVRPAEVLRGE